MKLESLGFRAAALARHPRCSIWCSRGARLLSRNALEQEVGV